MRSRPSLGAEAEEAEKRTAVVVGCAQLVLRRFGPCRTRVAYLHALIDELARRRIPFQKGVRLPLYHRGVRLDAHHLVELRVLGCVMVDVVTVERIRLAHCVSLRRRLLSTGTTVGVVVNFASARLVLRRVVVRHAGAFCLSDPASKDRTASPGEGRRPNPPC